MVLGTEACDNIARKAVLVRKLEESLPFILRGNMVPRRANTRGLGYGRIKPTRYSEDTVS